MLHPRLVRIHARLWTTASPAWRIRSVSSSHGQSASLPRRRLLPALLLLGLAPVCYTIHLDSAPLDSPVARDDTHDLSLTALIRTYAVYSMCSIPALVDNAPLLLDLSATIPGVRWLAEAFVRATFFKQFVGGDTVQDTLPVLHKLRAANTGTLLAYSVEVDEKEALRAYGPGSRTPLSTPHKHIVQEMLHCVDVVADFEDALEMKQDRKTWVAIKLSALLPDAHALTRLSAHLVATRPPPYSSLGRLPSEHTIPFPGCAHPADLGVLMPTNHQTPPPSTTPDLALTPTDLAALYTLYQDLRRICTQARARGVRIIVDGEYSWCQPAIDALVKGLMREFNKPGEGGVQPLVYGTYQGYLRRTPAQLARDLHDAREGGYALGVKLVRGAYRAYEVAAHESRSLSISPDPIPPVHLTKRETDACYDECVHLMLGAVAKDLGATTGTKTTPPPPPPPPTVGVLFGTHNWKSCDLVLEELVRLGLASKSSGTNPRILIPEPVTARVALAQLYGMCDDLTAHLVALTDTRTGPSSQESPSGHSGSPLVLKYLPYGALAEVMPYLARRAVENRGVLSAGETGGASGGIGQSGQGGARGERRRAARALRRRVWAALGWSNDTTST
ncbi:hypothetical protein DXG03_005076 [Asterophora parasitica]|uniref:Proline dehydrogenase n=1 Tax=Asterophora parasitica TaxID=117018 RepID=A0A9P7K9W2_9AGAR|nr:hypothetical protein DXG03_005076 [Asterophora parasitica]